MLVGIRNFTDTPRELDVQLAVEGEPFDEKGRASIPRQGKPNISVFSGDPAGLEDKVISVHLQLEDDFEDDFALDNSAFARPVFSVSQLRILLVSDNAKVFAAYAFRDIRRTCPTPSGCTRELSRDRRCAYSNFRWWHTRWARSFQWFC